MVIRRVQEVGGTYFITLPKRWVVRLGIERGAELHVEERGDGVLMVAPTTTETSQGLVEAIVTYPMKFPVTLKELVTSLYLSGYDLIRIRSIGEGLPGSERRSLLTLSRKLAGMEVIEENRENMTIRCVLDPASMRPRQILRRMGFIVSDMIQDLSHVEDVKKLESVVSSDDEVDRSYLLLVRLLRSALRVPWLSSEFELEQTDYLDYRVAAGIVESVGDRISNTAEACISDDGLKVEVKTIYEYLYEIAPKALELSLEAFITNDYTRVEEARSTISKLCCPKTNGGAPLLNFIQEACRNLVDLVSIEKIVRKHIKA